MNQDFVSCVCQSKDLQLDIIPATAPGLEVKLRDAAAHELNEEKRKSARRKEYVYFLSVAFSDARRKVGVFTVEGVTVHRTH